MCIMSIMNNVDSLEEDHVIKMHACACKNFIVVENSQETSHRMYSACYSYVLLPTFS